MLDFNNPLIILADTFLRKVGILSKERSSEHMLLLSLSSDISNQIIDSQRIISKDL
jgi:hypothetical protein